MDVALLDGGTAPEVAVNLSPPWWLPGGHVQTIASAFRAERGVRGLSKPSRERWTTPDGDFIDVDRWPAREAQAPLLVVFHGLEGSSRSHYAQAVTRVAVDHGWAVAIPHFRGCSGELNQAPRAYHSGDHAEVDWILRRFKDEGPERKLLVLGVSLGGNALALWAALRGHAANTVVCACATMSAPLDLGAAGRAIDRGLNRRLYARMFLSTMVPKAEAKWRQYPGLFDLQAARRAKTLFDFDNVFTAPLHGFPDTQTYWAQAAARPHLGAVRVPMLLLNARNDPFVPAESLPTAAEVSSSVTLWQPQHGGHAGFAVCHHGRLHLRPVSEQIFAWLHRHARRESGHG